MALDKGAHWLSSLYYIALDCAYKFFRLHDDTLDTLLRSSTHEIISVSGCADDTAIYLRRRSDITKVIERFEAFDKVVGLDLNKFKSTIVVLGQTAPMPAENTCGTTILRFKDHCLHPKIRVVKDDSVTMK